MTHRSPQACNHQQRVRIPQRIVEDPWILIEPSAIFLGIAATGLVIRSLAIKGLRRWSEQHESQLGLLVADSLHNPLLLWVLILAGHVATGHSQLPTSLLKYLHPSLEALWVWSLISVLSRLVSRSVSLYGGRVTGAKSVTSLTEKLVQLVILSLGIAWLLRVVFNVNLTPILTTLGVGGIAVALALQDTLSNLFAGFYVSISGLITIGDLIRLNTGEEGYVADITWRCTTLTSPSGNLVVVPNNKLGQAIYTNFSLPENRLWTSVNIGVGFDAAAHPGIDLLEARLLQTTNEIAASGEVTGLLADPAPSILFNGPGDWCMVFQVNLAVSRFADVARVQSEVRKRLWKRLLAEGIPMPVPVRTVHQEPHA